MSARRTGRLPTGVRSLSHRSFRLYFFGQSISILGTWVQQVALSWLIYRNTGSAALLGLSTFCALAPQLVVGPIAGALVDANDKKKWAIVVQCLLAAQAFALAALVEFNILGAGGIIAMSLLMGVLSSFDMPLRQSLIASFVDDRHDLTNAIALNTMLYNMGRLVGPPLAGLLLAFTSEAACFAFNGCSYLLLFATLLVVTEKKLPRAEGQMRDIFVEGLAYAWRQRSVRIQLVILIVFNLTASAYSVLLPIFARDIFAGDATTLGWLWGLVGAGAFAGTFLLASILSVTRLFSIAIAGVALSAVSLLALSMTRQIWPAMIEMFALGFGIAICNAGINIVLQHNAPAAFRGRIVTLFTSIRFGFDALGGLIAGVLAAKFGAVWTIAMEGGVLLLFAVYLVLRRKKSISDFAVEMTA